MGRQKILTFLLFSTNILLNTLMAEKIAVITGANKGIGLEIATKFAQAGYRTIVAARNPDLGEEAVSKLKSINEHVEFRQLDIS